MAGPIKISIVGDAKELDRALALAEKSMNSASKTADKAAANIDTSFKDAGGGFTRVTEHADAAATRFSILGGAVGDVSGGIEAFGSKLGLSEDAIAGISAASEGLSTALMFGAGVADIAAVSTELLNGATLKGTAIKVKDKAVTIAKTAAEKIAAVTTKAMAAGQWALNAAMAANPIGLVVLAIAALVAGFVIAYKNSETFRNIVNGALNAVKNVATKVFNGLKTAITTAFNFVVNFAKNWSLPGLIFKHIDKIKGFFNGLVTFVKGVPGKIKSAASGMFNGIRDAFKGALNFVIRAWNNFDFSVKLPKLLGGGTIGIGTPNIPLLAKGGIVTGPTLAIIGEGKHDEAVIPLDGRHGLGGNTYKITVVAPVGSSPADIGRSLVNYIGAYEKAGGRRAA